MPGGGFPLASLTAGQPGEAQQLLTTRQFVAAAPYWGPDAGVARPSPLHRAYPLAYPAVMVPAVSCPQGRWPWHPPIVLTLPGADSRSSAPLPETGARRPSYGRPFPPALSRSPSRYGMPRAEVCDE